MRGAAATVDRPLLGWMGRFFLHNVRIQALNVASSSLTSPCRSRMIMSRTTSSSAHHSVRHRIGFSKRKLTALTVNGPEITMPKDNIHHGGWEHRDIHNINAMLFVSFVIHNSSFSRINKVSSIMLHTKRSWLAQIPLFDLSS